MGARFYSPTFSIFTSVSPLSAYRSWISPYNYVQNNPVMRQDPTEMLDVGPGGPGEAKKVIKGSDGKYYFIYMEDIVVTATMNTSTADLGIAVQSSTNINVLRVNEEPERVYLQHALNTRVLRPGGADAVFNSSLPNEMKQEALIYAMHNGQAASFHLIVCGGLLDLASALMLVRFLGPNVAELSIPSRVPMVNLVDEAVTLSDDVAAKEGKQGVDDFISSHAYTRHKFDPSRISSRSRTQYGRGIDVADIRNQTMNNADDVVPHFDDNGVHYATTYKKTFNQNISTSATPTRESRVIINHLDASRSSQFPYYKKGVTDGF